MPQRKFILKLLEEYGVLGAKPSSICFEVNTKLLYRIANALPGPIVYRRL